MAAELSARSDDPVDTVLDASAGTDVSTRVFVERAQRPVALDISREMLRELEAVPQVPADFDHLPFVDGSFDGVAFTASLFFVPDPAVAARKAARVLRPSGVVGALALLDWVVADGTNVFADLERESWSLTGDDAVEATLTDAFPVSTGSWRFGTTAADVRRFHTIPAIAVRLYPRLPADERVSKTRDLLADLGGTVA